ncbi:uncharacterized protein LOC125238741 [Leguminivora glycinivorella]|uniref:uncharacterized protein LOC125238741 n=1 Tax=Leguminivora glycinivorella TaxID=1035111 RepID=UPI00200C5F21|nr:uncharacterized protein LOC125238741 [Leguminivora glycinivorella]
MEPCNKDGLDKLDLIQAKCLRIILGAMRCSPKNGMQVESVDPPLALRRQYLADRFLIKSSSYYSHLMLPRLWPLALEVTENRYWTFKVFPRTVISFSKLINIYPNLYKSGTNPIFEVAFETLIYTPKVILDIGIFKNDPGANNKFNKFLEKWSNYLPMFTDASKMDATSCVGAAVWIPRYNIALPFKCPPQSSIFTGEAVAILEAVKYAETHNISKAIIFTDSKSCLQAIIGNQFKMKIKFPLILEIKTVLRRCESKGLTIVLSWIPSHCGINGNEMVDTWARQAIDIGSVKSVIYSTDLLSGALADMFATWQEQWDISKLQTGKHYGCVQPRITRKPWFYRFRNSPKWVISTICRLRLGKVCTPLFLAMIGVRANSLCQCGQEEGFPFTSFIKNKKK